MGRQHSSVGPSQAPRYVQCPGSVQLLQRCPDTDKTGAAEGNEAHGKGAHILRRYRSCGTCESIEDVCPDAMMRNAVDTYVRDVLRIIGNRQLPIQRLLIEAHVSCSDIHNDLWGWLDTGIADYAAGELIVWDFKYGWVTVNEWRNWQGICYLLGLWREYGYSNQFKKFTFRVVQPRPYCERGRIREWSCSDTDMRQYRQILAESVRDALGPDPLFQTGTECKYCGAFLACPAAYEQSKALIDVFHSYRSIKLNNEHLSREYEQLLSVKEILDYRLTVVEEELLHKAKKGEVVPGWSIENVKGRAVWAAPLTEITALGGLYNTNLIKDPEPITVAQAIATKRIPIEVINRMSKRKSTVKLVPDNGEKARRVFNGN